MSKKHKKRRKKERRVDYNRKDYHHYFFQGRHYKVGYAKILRESPYCGAYIPQMTLHREIHSKIHDVPTPNGADCRYAVNTLKDWLEEGRITLDDSPYLKLAYLYEIFKDRCPATASILKWQQDVIWKFYHKGGD